MSVLEQVTRLCAEKNFAHALALIREAESRGCATANLLTKKAMCLQLVDDDDSLEEVEQIFQSALELDPRSVEALVEFGWYQLNVNDDAHGAEALFRRALEVQTAINTEILVGIAKCRKEISPSADPEKLLAEMKSALVDEGQYRKTLK